MKTFLLISLYIVVVVLSASHRTEASDESEEKGSDDVSSKFLYLAMGPDAYPIQEYIGKEIAPDDPDMTDPANLLPEFLTGTKGNRVVEFYAPWCPHCKHFKPTYIRFAKNMTEHAKKEYKMDITFHAVSCTVHKKICRRRGIKSYPTLELIPEGQVNGTHIGAWQLHHFTVLKEFGVGADDLKGEEGAPLLDRIKEAATGGLKGSDPKRMKQGDGPMNHFDEYPSTKEIIYQDAYLSFDFALRQSIFMTNGPLINDTLTAFEDWIDLINVVLPPVWKIHDPIRVIVDNFDDVVESEDNLLRVMSKFRPPAKSWSDSCKKGDDALGYTCGLWQLFHIVTVGTIEWNKHAEDDGQVFSTHEVAEVLRNYIANFFACEECRANFLTAYDTCAHDRCNRLTEDTDDDVDWKQLPLWLWETHNAVNVRLAKERAEREGKELTEEDELLVQWPSRQTCPLCWKSDGRWEEDAVWKYLRMTYWPDDAPTRMFRIHLSAAMNKKSVDDDALFRGSYMSWMVSLVGVAAALVLGAGYLQKKLTLRRTGRHKKYDLVA